MGTFDRSKFKATQTSKMKEQQKEAEETLGQGKGGNRANFLKLVHGKNKVRILPGHPGSDSFCYPRTTHYLNVLVKYKKDGKDVEEIKPKPIFNAKIHGGLSEDPIDAYIDMAYKIAFDEIPDEKERAKFLAPITNFKTGIKAKTRWVVYAIMMNGDERELGRLDLPVTVKEKLNEMAVDADEDEGVIQTDPFTDPDEGHCVTITYNKDAEKPGDYYKATLDYKKATPVTDEELDWLSEQPTLESMLVDSYSMKDFDMAIEGLKRFDEENEFNIFSHDEFLDKLEKLAENVPEAKDSDDDEEDEDDTPKRKKTSAKEEKVKESKAKEEKSDLPFDLELEEMDMDQLKGVIRREGLNIRILSKYDEQDVVEMIKEEREIIAAESKKEDKPKKKANPIEEDDDDEEEEAPRRKRGSRLAELQDEVEED